MAGKTIRILSIDGGGVRGIIPARWLVALEQVTGRRVCELFDLIAGTSTGGLLGLGLTVPNENGEVKFRAEDLVELYLSRSKEVFSREWWKVIASGNSLVDEKYSSVGLEKVLKDYFGEAMLADTLTNVLVTSYEIERRSAFFFKSWKSRTEADHNFLIRDVARATSAAPTYFEPAKLASMDVGKYFALVDGGVYANNPSMCAFVEAKKMYPEAEQFILVSLGTGQVTEPLHYNEARGWGLSQWARPILGVVFDGVQDTVDYQLRMLLPNLSDGQSQFYRFQIKLNPGQGNLDDVREDQIRSLLLLGEELARNTTAELMELGSRLVGDGEVRGRLSHENFEKRELSLMRMEKDEDVDAKKGE